MPDYDDLVLALRELMEHHAFEVSQAIAAHAEWKRTLRDAVVRGYCEHGADEVGRDDACALGRWLASLPPETQLDPIFEQIVEMHARFHRTAAVVVHFLEAGRVDDARAAMDPDSEFALASEELVELLGEWRRAA